MPFRLSGTAVVIALVTALAGHRRQPEIRASSQPPPRGYSLLSDGDAALMGWMLPGLAALAAGPAACRFADGPDSRTPRPHGDSDRHNARSRPRDLNNEEAAAIGKGELLAGVLPNRLRRNHMS